MFDTLLVLGGGRSTRFWPLENKNLISFLGKTHLQYQLEKFCRFTKKIIIVANQDIFDEVKQLVKNLGVSATCLVQEKPGQAEAILTAKNYLLGSTLIVNASDIIESDLLKDLGNKIHSSEADAIIASKVMTDYFPGGYVVMKDNLVQEIVEKPEPNNVPSNAVKLVADAFKDIDDFISILEKTESARDDQYEVSLSKYIKLNKKVSNYDYSGKWITIKFPWDVLDVMKYHLNTMESVRNNIDVRDQIVIKGKVYIEEGVKVMPFATIVGPAYIGKNSVIGSYSLVRDCHIGEDCMIGGFSEVTRSYLGSRVYLHRNYVGDSVLADDILLGADAVTANYRFDSKPIFSLVKGQLFSTKREKFGTIIGSNVKIGVNSSIMPGVKIGKNNVVNPQDIVKRDIS